MKATDLVKGEWYQVKDHRGWHVTQFGSIQPAHVSTQMNSLHGGKDKQVKEPEASWFGNFIKSPLHGPNVRVETKGIESKIRPVSEETKAQLTRIIAEYTEAQAKVAAVRQEWDDWTKA